MEAMWRAAAGRGGDYSTHLCVTVASALQIEQESVVVGYAATCCHFHFVAAAAVRSVSLQA
jgi:hypothetical protein